MKYTVELTIQHMTVARLLVAMHIKIGHVIIPAESSSAGLIVPSIALLHRPSTATSDQLRFAQIPVDHRTDGLNAAQQVFVVADADADADDGKRVQDYMQCSAKRYTTPRRKSEPSKLGVDQVVSVLECYRQLKYQTRSLAVVDRGAS